MLFAKKFLRLSLKVHKILRDTHLAFLNTIRFTGNFIFRYSFLLLIILNLVIEFHDIRSDILLSKIRLVLTKWSYVYIINNIIIVIIPYLLIPSPNYNNKKQ